MNRVFDEAVARGYMNKSHVPVLINKGRDSSRRPDFRREEYKKLIGHLPSWIDKGRDGKSRDMRHLLRDYILILANTGIRHGTETANLKWQHVHAFEENGDTFLEMHVSGKTGPRDIICRANTLNFLKRLHKRTESIAGLSFEELLKKKLDQPVFCLPDGTVSKNLHQTFRILMDDTKLGVCPRTGQTRTLYSFRHTYATFALLNDGMSVHLLAKQMGTSIEMIERHYSHLTPRLQKELLTGKRHLPEEDYLAQMRKTANALKPNALTKPADETFVDLPAEPASDVENTATQRTSVEPANTPPRSRTDTPTAAEMAFDLFDQGKLSEASLLAAIGVDADGYKPHELISKRALVAVGEKRLSEEALLRVLGNP